MSTKIIVHDVHVHPENGHVTYMLRSETTEGSATWHGPIKQYGIDVQALRDRFNSDLSQFENHIAAEHKALIGAHPKFMDEALKRKGAVIG